jgi:hypothetical protein
MGIFSRLVNRNSRRESQIKAALTDAQRIVAAYGAAMSSVTTSIADAALLPKEGSHHRHPLDNGPSNAGATEDRLHDTRDLAGRRRFGSRPFATPEEDLATYAARIEAEGPAALERGKWPPRSGCCLRS